MITARVEVLSASHAEHGGRNVLAPGAGRVAHDFSVCLNAHGSAQAVTRAIQSADHAEYPDPRSTGPRAAAAAYWRRPIDDVVFGAGATELIQAICFAFLRPNDDVLIATPAFGEYARAATLCGARPSFVPLAGDVPSHATFTARLRAERPRLVFVATPISPTGEILPRALLGEIADWCGRADSLLVLDQSYEAFSDHPIGFPALPGHEAVAHLRSLTKEHALAGVRVGYAIAAPSIARAIEIARVPWSASTAAQSAAIATFTDDALQHVAHTTALLRSERRRIADASGAAGLTARATSTHYLTIDVGDARAARACLLAERHILVRDCTSFGMPRCIRVAARTPEANEALIAALRTLTHPASYHD